MELLVIVKFISKDHLVGNKDNWIFKDYVLILLLIGHVNITTFESWNKNFKFQNTFQKFLLTESER